ncbi:DNA-binding response regulator [Streptomyces mutabilis]|uniref:DNA-binding response regulator n=1 Tax=Streptomyces TaxID=1883 RepID=UPI0015CCE6F9|nr:MULTISPECIES: DNA-binding response regulator [unclassified Streptomyces]MDN3250957.1 DNA-binding response regulator [Streptomyces sp. ZSW22]MDN3257803.1 DNA-binding response regulator [Streptomyces sp. MA25(2023)]
MSSDKAPVIRVLLAEGEHALRVARSDLISLEDDVQVVAEVAVSSEVLRAARLHNPDVVVIASSLQGGSALAVASEVRSEMPNCPLVFLNTPAGPSLTSVLTTGVRSVLSHHATGRSLLEAVRTVHAGGRYVDQESVTDALTRHEGSTTS